MCISNRKRAKNYWSQHRFGFSAVSKPASGSVFVSAWANDLLLRYSSLFSFFCVHGTHLQSIVLQRAVVGASGRATELVGRLGSVFRQYQKLAYSQYCMVYRFSFFPWMKAKDVSCEKGIEPLLFDNSIHGCKRLNLIFITKRSSS